MIATAPVKMSVSKSNFAKFNSFFHRKNLQIQFLFDISANIRLEIILQRRADLQ